MKTTILFLVLGLVGCSLEPDFVTEESSLICSMVCDECEGEPGCFDACISQWSTYAFDTKKAVCADFYLRSMACRAYHACDDPGCGDPVLIMENCADEIERREL